MVRDDSWRWQTDEVTSSLHRVRVDLRGNLSLFISLLLSDHVRGRRQALRAVRRPSGVLARLGCVLIDS